MSKCPVVSVGRCVGRAEDEGVCEGKICFHFARVSITIFTHAGKMGNETGGEFVSCTLPQKKKKKQENTSRPVRGPPTFPHQDG